MELLAKIIFFTALALIVAIILVLLLYIFSELFRWIAKIFIFSLCLLTFTTNRLARVLCRLSGQKLPERMVWPSHDKLFP